MPQNTNGWQIIINSCFVCANIHSIGEATYNQNVLVQCRHIGNHFFTNLLAVVGCIARTNHAYKFTVVQVAITFGINHYRRVRTFFQSVGIFFVGKIERTDFIFKNKLNFLIG